MCAPLHAVSAHATCHVSEQLPCAMAAPRLGRAERAPNSTTVCTTSARLRATTIQCMALLSALRHAHTTSWRRALRFTPFRARVRVQGACSEPGFSCQHSTDSHSGGVSQDPMQAATGCLHLCHGILRYLISELAVSPPTHIATASPMHRHDLTTACQYGRPIRQLHGSSTRSFTASPRAAPRAVQTPWRGA